MKLIRCYIENFGGLSHYRLDFQQGITVVQEENGFGKTTLAEFIRAMFYGFPRSGKTMDKNPRKKYLPWNGGSYGGYLIFEHKGKQYRIDRKFGATPKGDTFTLTDAVTHQKSPDFTEDIGIELFGLDEESFERSTYMPQNHDHVTTATTGIQSKLGDLVHDTNDINNYDKAIKALKEKRSGYIPYRGKGGSVAEAVGKITELHSQLDLTEAKRPELEQLMEQLSSLYHSRSVKSGARDLIRKQLQQRSRYDAKVSAEKQLQSMVLRKQQLETRQQTLLESYPKGLPDVSQVLRMEQLLSRLPSLTPPADTNTDLEARAVVSQMGSRFQGGVPHNGDFTMLRSLDKELIEAESAARTTVLTEHEQATLEKLEQLFAWGIPDDSHIAQCRQRIRERASLQDRLENSAASEADTLRLKRLKVFFANGLPEEAELDRHQSHLEQIDRLRQENLRISSAAEAQLRQTPAAAPKGGKGFLLSMLLGAVLACAGIGLVIFSYMVPGLIALALGITLFAASFALKLKQDVARELRSVKSSGPVIREEDLSIMRANSQQIDRLEQQVTAFTAKYISDARPLQQKLSEIRENRARYLELQQRLSSLSEEATTLQNRLTQLTAEVAEFLKPYDGAGHNDEEQLQTLSMQAAQLRELSKKQELYQTRRAELHRACDGLRQKLDGALTPYYPLPITMGYTAAIAQLEKDAQRYTAAVAHLSEQTHLRDAMESQRNRLLEELEGFLQRYGISRNLTEPENLHRLRTDAQLLPQLQQQLQQSSDDIQAFRQEHRELLVLSVRDDLPDVEALQLSEQQLSRELQTLEKQIAALEQSKKSLCRQIDTIPQILDEIEQWQRKRKQDTQRSALLDQTIGFLEEARQSLSNKYMGTVQQRFIGYMNRIFREDGEKIFVTPQLEVTIERLGQPRSLDYFSAGQADMVALCMRLALVDALFEDVSPFIILDDPFVNLDDRNMKLALNILKELSRDHQILYLVCNSSRGL